MSTRRFDPAFKLETVRLINELGRKPEDVANEIGVHVNTIYKWQRLYQTYRADAFPGSGNLRPDDQIERDTKKRLRDLEEENAILKKALAIFAKIQR
jgi:transposase